MKQLALDIAAGAPPGFDTFIAAGNEEALQALRHAAPGDPPLYLWGPSGSGKTHLLQALRTEHPQACAAFDADSPEPWTLEPTTRYLLLDQAERWSPAQQHEAFRAFVEATGLGALVVAAGRFPPVDLPLREDIRTRLGWGLVLSLWPLGESTLRQALQEEARRRGLRLGDELLDYALRRLSRDLKSLSGLLDRLDRYALMLKRPLTVPLLRQMLDEEQQGLNPPAASAPAHEHDKQ